MCLSCTQLQINNSINKCDIKWCDRKGTPYFPTSVALLGKKLVPPFVRWGRRGLKQINVKSQISTIVFFWMLDVGARMRFKALKCDFK